MEVIKGSELEPMTESNEESPTVRSVESVTDSKKKLLGLIDRPTLLNEKQTQELLDFISDHHAAFSLDDLERGKPICLTWRFTQGKRHQEELPLVACHLLSGKR